MMVPHLIVFGVVEGLVTGLVVHYLQRSRSAWMLLPAGEENAK
jgi:ABC-type Co2+ transport system permease subunit